MWSLYISLGWLTKGSKPHSIAAMEAKLGLMVKWDAIEAAVAQAISTSPEPFAPATIANAGDFVRACRLRCPIPEGVAKGYWTTIRIWWKQLEVEVFDDRYELYQFIQGNTRIAHFEHAQGAELPQEFIDQLPKDRPLQD